MDAQVWRIGLVLAAALTGCVTDAELQAALDRDRDGYLPIEAGGDDCDETRASVNPGAEEICGDGVDNDCDGVPDDDGIGSRVFYVDADGDGFGADGADSVTACERPEGYAAFEGDCADDDPSRNPNAEDLCDGIDQNCDGQPDDDDLLVARYPDADGDGIGVEEGLVYACEELDGFVERSGDCDDTDATVAPNVEDACNGEDDNCNGLVDEDALNVLRFRDADGDQFGTDTDTIETCQETPGYVPVGGDCDDTDEATNPAALDTCDGIDRDCNGVPDDDAIEQTWYEDADGDGFGDDGVAVGSCAPISGFSLTAGDCDDGDAGVSPAIVDGCDGVDQNCNGVVDEDAPLTLFYEDADGDGSGVEAVSVEACVAPSGFVQVFGDCDDTDASIRPGSLDPCDGIDQDCDGAVDETATFEVWFEDADGDGLGDGSVAVSTCDGAPSGYVAQSGDCDDTDALVTVPLWYADADGDGYGTDASTASACVQPSGFADLSDDCDDSDALANPGRVEVCNNFRDDDCDSDTDCRRRGVFTGTDADFTISAPLDADVRLISDLIGGPELDWLVRVGGVWRVHDGADSDLFGVGLDVPCVRHLAPSPDVSGDGRPELSCAVDDHTAVIFESGTLQEMYRVELPGEDVQRGAVIRLAPEPRLWVPVGESTRAYDIGTTTTVGPSELVQTIDCPVGMDASGVHFAPSTAGNDALIVFCGGESADAYVFEALGFGASSVADADAALIRPSLDTVQLVGLGDPGLIRIVVVLDVNGGLTGFSEVYGVPVDLPLEPVTRVENLPNQLAFVFPFGDIDSDGFHDFFTGPSEGDEGRIIYGGPDDISILDDEAVLLPSMFEPVAFEPILGAFDWDEDGFHDILLYESDGVTANVLVFRGTGE